MVNWSTLIQKLTTCNPYLSVLFFSWWDDPLNSLVPDKDRVRKYVSVTIFNRPVRWLVSRPISPADADLLWEKNTISWLISPGWNRRANRLWIGLDVATDAPPADLPAWERGHQIKKWHHVSYLHIGSGSLPDHIRLTSELNCIECNWLYVHPLAPWAARTLVE